MRLPRHLVDDPGVEEAQERVSATGGSARSQAVDADARAWTPRRSVALGLRAAVVILPFLSSFLVGRLLGDVMPHPEGPAATAAWWSVIVLGSTIALVGVDRVVKRLLPVAMLFRLALVFPDKAPSRYSVALRSGTAKQLRERLESGGDLGDTPSEAAANLLALVAALGKHDRITRGHSERVRAYSDVIAGEMGLNDDDRQRLHWAALVHDVGKMAVRPAILNKAGRPTDEEWQELRNHPTAAAPMVAPLRPWLGDWVDAATQHHERFDGKGYPGGIAGGDITLAGRIVAVADAYDCMTSARSYKKALPAEQARYELTRNSGTQFDPDVVRALLGVSVGKLHLAGGPLSWLAQIPGAREGLTLSGAGGASVSTALAAAAVTVVGAVGGVFAPPTEAQPELAAARVAPVEYVVDDSGRAVGVATVGTAEDGTPITVVVTEAPTAPGLPGAPVTAPPSSAGGVTTNPAPGLPGATTTTAPGGAPSTTRAPVVPGAATTTTHPPTTTHVPATTTAVPTTTTQAPTTTTAPPNQPPVAVNDGGVTVGSLGSTDIDVLANDSDDQSLTGSTLSVVSQPNRGSVSVTSDGRRIHYVAPIVTLGGTTTFKYKVCDAGGLCAQATVTVTLTLL